MTKMKELAGKHCNKEMEFRILPVNNEKEILTWIVYGICKKCKTVIISALFKQQEKPTENVDFLIDYNKAVKETNTDEIKAELFGDKKEVE